MTVRHTPHTHPVVIVGGGPNGLLLATELALAGVCPVVLEQRAEPSTEPKANGLVGRVVDALDRRGLYAPISGRGSAPAPVPYFPFGGLVLDLRDVDGNTLTAQGIPQRHLEELLERRARDLGADIRRRHRVTALHQDADAVTVEVVGPEGSYRMAAEYLVGADGGRSQVRKWCGIGFPGSTDESMVSRSGEVGVDPAVLVPGTGEVELPGLGVLPFATFTRTEHGLFVYGQFQPGRYRVSAWEWGTPADTVEPMTVAELRAAIGRVLGADLPITALPGSGPSALRRTTGINSRQAERYRHGRVLLLGDAAHVHSGVGGPGLNLGLQDALNLGWKLAATIDGWAPSWLLDSYHDERHPAGARVLVHTRAQMALLAPGPNVTALRQVFGELLRDEGTVRHVADLMSGAEVRYTPPTAAHPLTGAWLPDLRLTTPGGTVRVAELMRAARPLLLDLGGRADLFEVAEPWAGRVDLVRATTPDRPADAVLVRPDSYVAWACGPASAGDGASSGDQASALRERLGHWFGRSGEHLVNMIARTEE